MNCIICGKSDKSMETFHLDENMSNPTCHTCYEKTHGLKDNVKIVKVAVERIVNVYYAVPTDEYGDHDDSERVYLTEVDQHDIDQHEIYKKGIDELSKNHWLQHYIKELKTGKITNTSHLFKK